MTEQHDRPFWQDFMLRILWLLGVKPDMVETITIELRAGKLPEITIARGVANNGEMRQVFDVFKASKWELESKGPEQTWDEFIEEIKKPRASLDLRQGGIIKYPTLGIIGAEAGDIVVKMKPEDVNRIIADDMNRGGGIAKAAQNVIKRL